MKTTLNCLREGEAARITALRMQGALRRRLLDFGLIEGTKICCLRKSPVGNPVIYAIRGTRLALRTQDSCHITVETDLCD